MAFRDAVKAHPDALSGAALWISFAAVGTGAFIINIDGSIVSVVLPVLSQRFLVPIPTLQWVASAYFLVIGAVIAAGNWWSDALGRREVFLVGILGFVAGSILCALSPNFWFLVAARCFQGLGAAVIMGNQPGLVASIFSVAQRGRALGWNATIVAAGTLLGPPLGGWLTHLWGWRSIFWVNVPLGLLAVVGIWRALPHMPRHPNHTPGAFDVRGAGFFAAFAVFLELGLGNFHRTWGWALLAVSGLSLLLVIRQERGHTSPLLPLHILALPKIPRAVGTGTTYWILMMFPTFLLPLYLSSVLHLAVGAIGWVMMTQAATMVLAAPLAGGWMDRGGTRPPARTGMALFAVASLGFARLGSTSPLWQVVLLLAIYGIASACLNSPSNGMLFNAVKADDIGAASGISGLQRAFGRALGVALASISLSITWILIGVGPVLGLSHPNYAHWLLLGFQGSFWLALGVALCGFWLVPPSIRAR